MERPAARISFWIKNSFIETHSLALTLCENGYPKPVSTTLRPAPWRPLGVTGMGG